MRGAPPPLPRRLLEWILPNGPAGASILGDLTEEWSRRRPGAARDLWFWREALRLAVRYGAARVGSGVLATVADFRQGFFRVFRSPGHTALTVLALGLGIGAPATMYSIVAGLTRDLDVEAPDRLVHVGRRMTPQHVRGAELEWLRPLLGGVAGLESLSVFGRAWVDLSGEDAPPERRRMAVVSPDFFRVMRTGAAIGRTLTPGDARSGVAVVVLGGELFRSRFGGDASVLGNAIRVDGTPHTVVGVMPEGFAFPDDVALWTPLDPADPPRADVADYEIVGRLQDGATLTPVRARASRTNQALREAGHEIHPAGGLAAQPLGDRRIGPEDRRMLDAMVLVVSFVLLIACANVANLLLARALARSPETAVRMALGAGRGRVVRQHLAEAGALALLGGALGLALAAAGVRIFEAQTAPFLAHWMDFRLDLPTLLFSAGLVAAAALGTGLLPALRAGRVDVAPFLRDGDRGSSALRIGRVSRALVVGEVALSCALLVTAGIMVRGAVTNLATEGDYETASILTGRYELRAEAYPGDGEVLRFHRRVLEALEGHAGVADVALTSHLPGIFASRRRVEIEGRAYERPEDRPEAQAVVVSPGFFRTLGSDVVRGRSLSWDAGTDAPPVVLANEAFVRRHFPAEEALGKRIRIRPVSDGSGEPAWATIVGVVPALGLDAGRGDDGSGVYVPLPADPGRYMAILVRARPGADPRALARDVRRELAALDPDLALYDVDTLEGRIAEATLAESVFALLFVVFGIAGLVLASVGLYGLLSFTVRSRVRELGVRVAVGAGPGRILWTAVRGGALQLGLGLAAGLALAALVAPLLGEALLGQDPRDPLVYSVVAGTLALTGVLAALTPARRALAVDVVEALRTE